MAEDSEYVKSLKEQKKYYLDQLKKMRKALKKSNKPIIVVGSQCVDFFEFVPDIASILKSINILINHINLLKQ